MILSGSYMDSYAVSVNATLTGIAACMYRNWLFLVSRNPGVATYVLEVVRREKWQAEALGDQCWHLVWQAAVMARTFGAAEQWIR
jgi:hypothetical protein